MNEIILIVDFSHKYAQLTARRIRESNVYCEVVPAKDIIKEIENKKPKGIVITGDKGAKNAEFEQEILAKNIPILCLGKAAELIAIAAGKSLNSNSVYIEKSKKLFCYGIDPNLLNDLSKKIVRDFVIKSCGCKPTFTAKRFAEQSIKELSESLEDKKVLCALSGGVDSTVCAVLLHKAIGDNLTCIFVDHGLMRKNEGDEVMSLLKREFKMNVIRVDAEQRFLDKLKGVTDPEQKRKIIGAEFIDLFEDEAKKLGKIDYLLQGTIYPDVLESGFDGAPIVKSHHNVGGLPERLNFELVEPVRMLFKDEVRKVGAAIGIPQHLVNRQPFPGPGLGVRCLGELTKQKLDILRECDAIVREEIIAAKLDKELWQYFAVLPNLQSVGVNKNGERTYGHMVAIRTVKSIDAMEAGIGKIPYEVLEKMVARITSEVEEVNRVVYDVTPKPPATIEYE